jgi:hypothetical protein
VLPHAFNACSSHVGSYCTWTPHVVTKTKLIDITFIEEFFRYPIDYHYCYLISTIDVSLFMSVVKFV